MTLTRAGTSTSASTQQKPLSRCEICSHPMDDRPPHAQRWSHTRCEILEDFRILLADIATLLPLPQPIRRKDHPVPRSLQSSDANTPDDKSLAAQTGQDRSDAFIKAETRRTGRTQRYRNWRRGRTVFSKGLTK